MPRVLVVVLLSVALVAAGLIGGPASAMQTPEASPVAGSPVATPRPTPVVLDYATVGPAYDAARDELLDHGREVVGLLLAGDAAEVHARLAPPAAGLITEEQLGALIPMLESDRVHFALPEFGAVFDGHLAGRTIEGFFSQAGTTSFRLEAVDAPAAGRPLDGRWEGAIATGATELAIAVEFRTEGDELRGTIDIPEQHLSQVPLSDVGFRPTVELGDRIGERALPVSAQNRSYTARYAWGEAALTVTVGFDARDAVSGLMVAPDWPLGPDPAAGITTETALRLPFAGVWLVLWGGETALENYHVAAPSQRHAYDLAIWRDGGTHLGDGRRNEDYWAWGQAVVAPAAGRVVAVHDGIADNAPGVLNPEPHPAGNHVVIETAADEFVFLAHFQQGSIRVVAGDRVAAGDFLGLAGNSGNSSEPHLHIHAQNRPDYFAADAIGLPLPFVDYRADGEPVARGVPVQGQFVARDE